MSKQLNDEGGSKADSIANIIDFNDKFESLKGSPIKNGRQNVKFNLATSRSLKEIEDKLILGLRQLSFPINSSISMNDGATPSLKTAENPLDYFSKNKDRMQNLVSLHENVLDDLMNYSDDMKTILQQVKRGLTGIIRDLFDRFTDLQSVSNSSVK